MGPLGISTLQAVYAACLLAALLVGWYRVLRPKWQRARNRVSGAIDSIAGRDPVIDAATGRELAPRMPPIGEHLANINDRLNELSDVSTRLDSHEGRITALEADRTRDISNSIERAATANASAKMLDLISERDTLDGETEEP